VPFGKVAFFSGELVHTNELTVHIGASYYAERSARETVEILSRRRAGE
jgi:unconventional prefoldin RPB5 interactor 1